MLCKSDFSPTFAPAWGMSVCVSVCDGIEEGGGCVFDPIHLTDYLNPAHLSAHVKQMGSLLKAWRAGLSGG